MAAKVAPNADLSGTAAAQETVAMAAAAASDRGCRRVTVATATVRDRGYRCCAQQYVGMPLLCMRRFSKSPR